MSPTLRVKATLLIDPALVIEVQLLATLAVANIVLVTPDRVALSEAGIPDAVGPDLPVALALDIALPQAVVELTILLILPLKRAFLAQRRAASADVASALLLQVGRHGLATGRARTGLRDGRRSDKPGHDEACNQSCNEQSGCACHDIILSRAHVGCQALLSNALGQSAASTERSIASKSASSRALPFAKSL
ncbi:MAG: hypothetical protein AAGL24_15035 [Pseudomonadota bacterium]